MMQMFSPEEPVKKRQSIVMFANVVDLNMEFWRCCHVDWPILRISGVKLSSFHREPIQLTRIQFIVRETIP